MGLDERDSGSDIKLFHAQLKIEHEIYHAHKC